MKPSKKHGHSLVELVFAMVILIVVIGVPGMILTSSSRAFGTSTSTTGLDLAARRTLDNVVARLSASGLAGISDPQPIVPGVPLIGVSFRPQIGLDAGGPIWGAEERIELRMAPGEVLDGTDSNGNGLIDDGRVVWIPDTSDPSRVIVLCSGVRATLPGEILGNGNDDNGNGLVDERGFVIVFDADRVELTLALESRDTRGEMYQRVVTRSVALRN